MQRREWPRLYARLAYRRLMRRHHLSLPLVQVPYGGWIYNLRIIQGVTVAELAERLDISRQAVAELERREWRRTAALPALERAAAKLHASLVYYFRPWQPLPEPRLGKLRGIDAARAGPTPPGSPPGFR